MAITLYYAPQTNAIRIYATLEELGIPHEKVKIDIAAGDQKKPEFLALNPNGKVPTVVLDGTPMFESVAIQIALGERYGVEKGVWPEPGSSEHLQALSWIVWGDVTLSTALMWYFENTSEHWPAEQHNARQAELAMAEIRKDFGILDERLRNRPYLAGERFTIVDIDLGVILGWGLGHLGMDLSPYPHLGAWLGRVGQRPSVQAAATAG